MIFNTLTLVYTNFGTYPGLELSGPVRCVVGGSAPTYHPRYTVSSLKTLIQFLFLYKNLIIFTYLLSPLII